MPVLATALEPLGGFFTRAAVLLSLLVSVYHITLGWTRRRAIAGAIVALVGFLGAGAPAGSQVAEWAAAGLVLAVGLLAAYATVLRADLTMIPIALGTMMAIGALMRGAQRAVSRSAARRARRRRADGAPVLVAVPRAAPLASGEAFRLKAEGPTV